ncbi:MAG TPA: ATP-binding cassette domain-containing protein, partial [Phycisphaerales bacterium]|nr:ATP-binding cassette domain-containing protein [Phycisphaerales bacterium]
MRHSGPCRGFCSEWVGMIADNRTTKKADAGKTAGNGEGVVVLKGITKRFGKKLVLDNVSLSIEKGKTTVIIGPSGCGKTVLIKHLILLLRPNAGEVYFKGRRIDNISDAQINEVRTHYGFLFQG